MNPPGGDPRPSATGDLRPRLIWGIILAVGAIAVVLVGGWLLAMALVAVVAIIAHEWTAMTVSEDLAATGMVAVPAIVGVILYGAGLPGWGLIVVLLGAMAVGLYLQSPWAAGGTVYAAVLGLGLIAVRADPIHGLAAVFFLFAVVWGSDVAAYFTGRAIGGPKLWPAVSPKKTWSGFIGGTVVGAASGIIVAAIAGIPIAATLVGIAVVLSVLSAGGDLLESAIKRRFGKKDSGTLIPGHGGVMDRVDGLIAATGAGAIVGAIHLGWPLIGSGLMLW